MDCCMGSLMWRASLGLGGVETLAESSEMPLLEPLASTTAASAMLRRRASCSGDGECRREEGSGSCGVRRPLLEPMCGVGRVQGRLQEQVSSRKSVE